MNWVKPNNDLVQTNSQRTKYLKSIILPSDKKVGYAITFVNSFSK